MFKTFIWDVSKVGSWVEKTFWLADIVQAKLCIQKAWNWEQCRGNNEQSIL